jgi:hypothetical protein
LLRVLVDSLTSHVVLFDLYFPHCLVEGLELSVQYDSDCRAQFFCFLFKHADKLLLEIGFNNVLSHRLNNDCELPIKLVLLELILFDLTTRYTETTAILSHQHLQLAIVVDLVGLNCVLAYLRT